MRKVVMIGIDGLDADLLRVYGPALPNLRRLMLSSPFLDLTSCFPPDARTAWGSIYTGLNPARHGVLGFSGDTEGQHLPRGRTFWDLASKAGRRVCILNPSLAWPAWPVNGLLLATSPRDSQVHIYPEQTTLAEDFPLLPRLAGLPEPKQLETFYESLLDVTLKQSEAALALLRQETWDVFSLQLDALDLVQHYYWRYSDPGDPDYPGRNQFSSAIRQFYHLLDKIVGSVRSYMPRNAVLMVVSGHGHGRSSSQQLHLNRWLQTQHLQKTRFGLRRFLSAPYMRLKLKQRLIEFLLKVQLPASAVRLITPERSSASILEETSALLDPEATLARSMSLLDMNAFGGISFSKERIQAHGRNYEDVREQVQRELGELKHNGRALVRWVKKREELYAGYYLEDYPDLLFELQSDLAVGDELYAPLLGSQLAHYFVSGSHRRYGVFLINGVPEGMSALEIEGDPDIMDVTPTLLSLLEIAGARLDGRALLQPS
ncbi:MAG TPA: alkaline phosphatase family protein [Ktedonobacteraceae bacterium]|nr:alkaline phosphatase family protein [Ktedonobacteraceae bacterium]